MALLDSALERMHASLEYLCWLKIKWMKKSFQYLVGNITQCALLDSIYIPGA